MKQKKYDFDLENSCPGMLIVVGEIRMEEVKIDVTGGGGIGVEVEGIDIEVGGIVVKGIVVEGIVVGGGDEKIGIDAVD